MRRSGEGKRLPNWAIGLVLVVVVAVGSFFAYTKKLPWSDPYEVRAVFASAQNVRTDSPVRIAGVEVGKVTAVEQVTSDSPSYEAAAGGEANTLAKDPTSGVQAAVVTMTISEEGLPLHEDATFQLRPRLFLEGNLFVDVKPGTPNAREVSEDHEFPITQTSNSVQLDQVLTTLQTDVREDLRTFLDQFGNALVKYGGAEGFQELHRSSVGAYKFTSQVNEAFLGTQTHDLSELIRNLDKVIAALGQNERELQGFVTNLRTVAGSFAAEDAALEQAIAELPGVLDAAQPAFANLNASFPALRAFAREALPGVNSTVPTINAATPFIEQLRQLVSRDELRGLVADLRPTVPRLADLTKKTIPFLDESRALSSCFNEVIIPWSQDEVYVEGDYDVDGQDGNRDAFGKVYEETAYGLAGIASESRSGDANGQYIRVQASGSTNTVTTPPGAGAPGDTITEELHGITPFSISGAVPNLEVNDEDSQKTPFKPNRPCEEQVPPDLGATVGAPPDQEPGGGGPLALQEGIDGLEQFADTATEAAKLAEDGDEQAARALQDEALKEFNQISQAFEGAE